jgi:hypothetical protein
MAPGPIARFLARFTVRDSGEPASSNRASSFHLFWTVPSVPLDEVSASFELIAEPKVQRLYFWALQASFVEGGTPQGGAHLGLQWHPSYPANRAVNWGGYGDLGELDGSSSLLPSTLGNANTRDYLWQTGVAYRFTISSPEAGRWRGTITNLATGEPTVVRDLFSRGTHLTGPMVWTEAFCRCDDSPVMARWSEFRATADGMDIPVESARVNYQSYTQGGCTNTTVRPHGDGLVQITGTDRQIPQGRVLGIQ